MDKHIVVPVALFFSIVWVIKLIIDARMRYLYLRGGSPQTIAALVAGEERMRRLGMLRWGVLLTTLAVAFVIIDRTGADATSALTWGLIFGALGLGNLGAYLLVRREDALLNALLPAPADAAPLTPPQAAAAPAASTPPPLA
ncbi:hypothetical protein IP84_03765 [beta proteobacterium AAP99]|nr:hypothetical protein IP84_03765 [beta proteobacterium AAP99]